MLSPCCSFTFSFFFFNDTATTEIYTLSLHDALPISTTYRPPADSIGWRPASDKSRIASRRCPRVKRPSWKGSEEHTSELQSLAYLVCRLLLEKKQLTRLHRFSNVRCNDTSKALLLQY